MQSVLRWCTAAVGSQLLVVGVLFDTQWLQCSLVYGGDTAAVGSQLLVVCVLFDTQWLQCSLV